MNKGSTRVTIRIGDDLLKLIEAELESRLSSGQSEPWTKTDFIIQAIAEKLSHCRRSRRRAEQVRQEKVDPYRPRVVTFD